MSIWSGQEPEYSKNVRCGTIRSQVLEKECSSTTKSSWVNQQWLI